MDDRPRVVASSDAWSLARYRNLLVGVWRTEVQLSGIEATEAAIRRILAAPGVDHYGSLTVIEPEMSLRLSDEAREASTALQKRYMNQMACSAYVVEGNSFAMAAVRTLTAGMSLLTRSPYPIKSFSDAIAAAEWVGRTLDLDPSLVLNTTSQARGIG